jgi:hypothetical protein
MVTAEPAGRRIEALMGDLHGSLGFERVDG